MSAWGRRGLRFLVALAAIVLTAMFLGVAEAAAADSLGGEELYTHEDDHGFPPGHSFTMSCSPNGDGTTSVSFAATGAAWTGPYPGTFTASGTVTYGPSDFSVRGYPPVGGILALSVPFTIASGTTTVTGSLTLSPSAALPFFSDIPANWGWCHRIALGYPLVEYTAEIVTPAGTTSEIGFARGMITDYGTPFTLEFFPRPATVTLAPAEATSEVGTWHTVTASVATSAGAPVPGVHVHFSGTVSEGGTCLTDANGQCGVLSTAETAGVDVITGCADADRSGDIDATEPCGTATNTWSADADGDGVADSVDSGDGAFTDAIDGKPDTTGSIVDAGGLSVLVVDELDPDGVRVTVGEGTGKATLSVCGGTTLELPAGSELVLTCGSVTVQVVTGSAEIVLGGGLAVVSIPAGVTAKITDSGDGSFQIENQGGGEISVTVDGVTATIPAGETQTVETWDFQGFTSPVENPPAVNTVNAGQAVPLKWRLLDASGQPVTTLATATLTVASLDCPDGTGTPTPDLSQEATVGGLHNLGRGYYELNWKTAKTYAGSCKTLRLDIGDGVTHQAQFSLK